MMRPLKKRFIGNLIRVETLRTLHFTIQKSKLSLITALYHGSTKWQTKNHRMTRWALAIQKYDIVEIKHLAGSKLGDADGLSRAYS